MWMVSATTGVVLLLWQEQPRKACLRHIYRNTNVIFLQETAEIVHNRTSPFSKVRLRVPIHSVHTGFRISETNRKDLKSPFLPLCQRGNYTFSATLFRGREKGYFLKQKYLIALAYKTQSGRGRFLARLISNHISVFRPKEMFKRSSDRIAF